MKARTGGSESYGIDSESCPEGRQMNNPIDRVSTWHPMGGGRSAQSLMRVFHPQLHACSSAQTHAACGRRSPA